MSETPWYHTASVLHPNVKIVWLEFKWAGYPPMSISTIEKGVRAVMKDYALKMAVDKDGTHVEV